MQNLKYNILLVLSILLLNACENTEQYGFDSKVIVEAYLMPDKPASISISKLIPFNSELYSDTTNISELTIEFSDGTNIYSLTNYGDSLFADSSLIIADDNFYSISFKYGDDDVFATTSIPEKPQNCGQSVSSITMPEFGGPGMGSLPEPVEISWEMQDGYYYLIVVENTSSNPTVINEMDWTDEDRPKPVFRNEPIQDNSYKIETRQLAYYGTYRIIIYSLFPDYAVLYQNSGTNSQNLTGIESNVENGLGIFTGVNSDTLFLSVN